MIFSVSTPEIYFHFSAKLRNIQYNLTLSAGAYQGINYRHQNSVPWYAGEAKFRTRTTKILLELVRSL